MAGKKISNVSTVFVEIGSDWFKILQGGQTPRGLQVSRMHLEKFDTAGSGLSKAVASAFKKNKFPGGPVVSCLPRQMVNIRMLELPSVDPGEIDDMVGFQAGKQTPYSKDEIVYDYRIIGGNRDGYTKVMLAIVQRSVLRQRYSILEEAGLEIGRMSVSSEGVLNWYASDPSRAGRSDTVVLIDVDTFYSDFMVLSGGVPVFTRSIMTGANHLQSDSGKAVDQFIQEVEQSIQICQGESHDMQVGTIYLTGAGPGISGLCEQINSHLGVPAENLDCMKSVSKLPASPSLKDPVYSAVSLTSLVGMAMNPALLDFNLVPDSVRLRNNLIEKARTLTAFGMIVMFLLVSASMHLTSRLYYKKSRLAALQATMNTLKPDVMELQRKKAIIDVAIKRRETDFAAINLLAELHTCVPDDMYFDSVDFNLNAVEDAVEIRLTGTTGVRTDVSTLVRNLEKSRLFRNAQSTSTTKDSRSNRHVFEVTCSVEREQ